MHENGSFIGDNQPATSATEVLNTDSQSSASICQPSTSASLFEQPAVNYIDTAN